jgi:hypothetical protein
MLLDALSAPAPLRSDMTHKAVSRLLPNTTDVFVQSYGGVDGTTMDLNFQLTSRQQRAVVSFMDQFFTAVETSGKTLSVFSKPDLKKMGVLIIPSFSAMKSELEKATNCQISSLHKTFTTAVQILGKMAKVRAAQSCDRMLACVNYAMHYSKLALEYETTRQPVSVLGGGLSGTPMSIEEVLELALCESHMSSERLAELGLTSARAWKMGLNKKYELRRCDKLIREAAAAIHIIAAYGLPACFISFASELLMNIRQANVGTTCTVLRNRSLAKVLKTRKAFATSHKALLLLPEYSNFVAVGKVTYNNQTIHLLDVLFQHMFPECENFPAYLPQESSPSNELLDENMGDLEFTAPDQTTTTTTITNIPGSVPTNTTTTITTTPSTTIISTTTGVTKNRKRVASAEPSTSDEEEQGFSKYRQTQNPAKKAKTVDVVVSDDNIAKGNDDDDDNDDFYEDEDEDMHNFADYESDPYDA